MRKRSSYKPRPKLIDPLGFVLTNVQPVNAEVESSVLMRASSHAAIDEIAHGRGTKAHMRTLTDAMNVALVLAKRGKGRDWLPELRAAQAAIRSLAERATRIGRYTLTGQELAAFNLALEIHDKQLDACTVGELGSAADYVARRVSAKQGYLLPKEPE